MARFSNRLAIIIAILLFGTFSYSCQNGDDIGSLYGQWRLEEATDASGVSFAKEGMYLSFQDKVACVKQVNTVTHGYQDVYAAFQQKGDSLLFHFSSISHSVDDTTMVCRTFRFQSFTNTRLHVENEDDNQLVLEDKGTCWRFKKY